MLKKLLKYDLKYIYKVLIVFYLLAIIFSVFTKLCFQVENSTMMNILGYICSGVTISMIFNILINNFMRLWVRFKNNLYGDESYLTHTLPVKKETIYASKFLSTVITVFISVLVIALTIFIAYYSKENLEMIKNTFRAAVTTYNISIRSIISFLAIGLFVIFLEIMTILQSGYTGIILGHKSNDGKMVKSVIYGLGLYILTSIIALLVLLFIGLFEPGIKDLFFTNNIANIDIFKTVLHIAVVFYIFVIAIYYIVDVHIFKKGVNVD